jgi:hypothetical protein
MPFSFRMPKALERYVRQAARQQGKTVSDFVRETVMHKLERDLFSGYPSSRTGRATKSNKTARDKIHARVNKSRKTKAT